MGENIFAQFKCYIVYSSKCSSVQVSILLCYQYKFVKSMNCSIKLKISQLSLKVRNLLYGKRCHSV